MGLGTAKASNKCHQFLAFFLSERGRNSTMERKETLYKKSEQRGASGWIKAIITRPSRHQHIHCLYFGFQRKRFVSRMCFHERPIPVFCIKFYFFLKFSNNIISETVIRKTKTHDLLPRRHLPRLMINPPPLQYQPTLRCPNVSQPYLITGIKRSFHRTT